MRARTAIALVLMAVAPLFVAAAQQQQPIAVVESEGEARIAVVPDEVHFEFTKSFHGPTLTDAATQAAVFEKALTKALADLDAVPTVQNPLRVVTDLAIPQVHATVAVTFLAPEASTSTSKNEPAAAPLVDLAERVRKAAISLMAKVAFTGFGVKDRETPEQDAIARASENALYHAEAVGTLLEGQVLGAEKVTVLETRWDGLKSDELPSPPHIECVARVRIAYQYSTRAR